MLTYPVETVRFKESTAERSGGAATWHARAQNFVVSYSTLDAGGSVSVTGSNDEYVALLVEGAIEVEAGADRGTVRGDAVIIVPPGDSRIVASEPAVVCRIFAPPTPELLAKCPNDGTYAEPHENVAPFELWPMPVDGYKLRIYEYAAMPEGVRKIFRSRNIMVNWQGHPGGPARDLKKFTPHSHTDFEQGSVELWGTYVHHLRYPWGPDSTAWRPDERVEVDGPGMTVMPVNVIHTSQGMSEFNCLADVFAPPRLDFSLAGYVYNAAEYPMPEGSEALAASMGRVE
jgi:hypothetical protein